MLISIVMPNYNKEDHILISILSVINQTYKDFELIIVDDGSTDNSVSIISRINDERILLVLEKNSGAAHARNVGIQFARSQYIAFLDSDDYWFPNYLEKMLILMNEFSYADAYGCGIKRMRVDPSVKNLKSNVELRDSGYIIDDYFSNVLNGQHVLTASSTIIKKTLIEKIGWFEKDLRNWEDFDFWLRAALYGVIAYNDNIYAVYNEVENSTSSDKSNLHAPVFDNYKAHLRKSKIKGNKRKNFIKLVAEKECHAAYEKYLVDNNSAEALKRILAHALHLRNNKNYWALVLNVASPRLYSIIQQLLHFLDNSKTGI